MTSFEALLKQRQSVRRYQNKAVEKEKIEKLAAAVQLAPSACNSQPWKLIVVDDPDLKDQVARSTFNDIISFNRFVLEAPVIAVLVIEEAKLIAKIGGTIKNQEFPQYDIGIAAAHYCLQAEDLGLGTCMIGWFNEKKIKQLLNVPRNRKIGLVITTGYAPDDYRQRIKVRKPLEVMCSYNGY